MENRIRKVAEEHLDNALTDIFLTIQYEYNIPTGDLAPLLDYELTEKRDELIDSIVECLKWQKENN